MLDGKAETKHGVPEEEEEEDMAVYFKVKDTKKSFTFVFTKDFFSYIQQKYFQGKK